MQRTVQKEIAHEKASYELAEEGLNLALSHEPTYLRTHTMFTGHALIITKDTGMAESWRTLATPKSQS